MIKIIKKPIKHLYLRIYNDGRVVVSAPRYLSDAQITDFIEQKRVWIDNKLAEQAKQRAAIKPINSDLRRCANSGFYKASTGKLAAMDFLGRHYPINYVNGKSCQVKVSKKVCRITVKPQTTQAQCRQLLLTYYRQQLMARVGEYVAYYAPIIGVSPHEVRSKNMKTKWGSCNTRAKRLWFNVQLARFSPPYIEYVVVHEMTHLLEANHSRQFYDL